MPNKTVGKVVTPSPEELERRRLRIWRALDGGVSVHLLRQRGFGDGEIRSACALHQQITNRRRHGNGWRRQEREQ